MIKSNKKIYNEIMEHCTPNEQAALSCFHEFYDLQSKFLRIVKQDEAINILYKCYGISITPRQLRRIYQSIRDKFADGKLSFTICHCADGNYITDDPDDIRKDNEQCRKTAYRILKYSYDRDKRVNKDSRQITLKQYANDLLKEMK